MNWLLKLLLLLLAIGLIIYATNKSRWINGLSLNKKIPLSVCIFIVGAFVFSYPVKEQWKKDYQHIIISPDRLSFTDSEWNYERTVEIKNIRNDTIHRIIIKTETLGGNFNFGDIITELESPDQSLVKDIGDTRIYYELIGFNTFDKYNNNPCIYYNYLGLKVLTQNSSR